MSLCKKSKKKSINIGWIKNKKIPKYIEKFNLKKKGDISKIIFYHKKFLIFKLTDIQNSPPKKITNNIIKSINFLKQKIINKNKKNIVYKDIKNKEQKKIIQKLIQKKYLNKEKNKIQIYKLKTKNLFLFKKNYKNTNFIKKIKNIRKKKIYIEYQKKIYKKNRNLIRKFISLNNSKKKIFLKTHKILFQKIDKKKIILNHFFKIKFYKKKCIYSIIYQKNHMDQLLILKQRIFKKISSQEKIKLIRKIKKNYKIIIIKKILKKLYQQSTIKYNFFTNELFNKK